MFLTKDKVKFRMLGFYLHTIKSCLEKYLNDVQKIKKMH